jgi:sulfur transfer complex TusBCD TusB component (DsrH family)
MDIINQIDQINTIEGLEMRDNKIQKVVNNAAFVLKYDLQKRGIVIKLTAEQLSKKIMEIVK